MASNVRLTWTSFPGATAYHVHYDSLVTGTFAQYVSVTAPDTSVSLAAIAQPPRGSDEKPAGPTDATDGSKTPESGQRTGGKEEPKPTPPPRTPQTSRRITWEGEVPPQKWMNFYTKVLSPYATEKGLKLVVKVKVERDEGISKQRVDETKTALKELGLFDNLESE
jgi:hypothetical protein